MKANWAHLRNISTIITAGALAVQFQVGFPHRQAAVPDSLRPRVHAGLVGLWVCGPRCRPRAQDTRVSDLRKQPGGARPGVLTGSAWAGSPSRGSTEQTRQQAHPAPSPYSTVRIWTGTFRPLRDMGTGQAGALWPQRRRQGPGDPLGSRCQFGTDRVTKALVLQGGDPQAPGHQA